MSGPTINFMGNEIPLSAFNPFSRENMENEAHRRYLANVGLTLGTGPLARGVFAGGRALLGGGRAVAAGAPAALPAAATPSAAQARAAAHNVQVISRSGQVFTVPSAGAASTGTASTSTALVPRGRPPLPGGGASSTAAAPGTSVVPSAPGVIVESVPGALVPAGQALSGAFGSRVAQAQAQAAAHNARVGGAMPMGPAGSTSAAAGRAPTAGWGATTTTGPAAAAGAPAAGGAPGVFARVRQALSRSGRGSGAGTAGAATTPSPTAAAAGQATPGFFAGVRRPLTGGATGVGGRIGQSIGLAGRGGLTAFAPYYGTKIAEAMPRERERAEQRRLEAAIDGVPYPDTLFGPGGAAGRLAGAIRDPGAEGRGRALEFLVGPGRPSTPASPATAPTPAPGSTPRTTPLPAPSVDDLRADLPGGGGAAGGVTGGVTGGVGGTGGGVPGLPGVPRNLFQLQETDEERALIARAIADIQRRRDEGTAALRSGWTNVQSANTAAAEKARALVEQRGGRAESIWTGAEERTREEAARRAAAAGGFEGRAAIDIDTLGGAEDFVRFMQSQAPAERALAEAEQAAFAEDLEFLAALAGSQGEAYASDLGRLSAAMEFERQAQHDRDVQDRINMERMALAQMEFAARQAAAAASRQEQKDVSTILTGLSGSFPAPNADPETARRTLSRIAASLFSQMGGLITEEQAIQYVVDWGESIAFRNLEQEFLQKIK